MDYLDLANEYQQNGKYDLAIENYLKAVNKEPENTKIYNALAICYYCKKDYESAITIYEEAVKIRPDYAMAYNNLGIIYSDRQEYDLAIDNYIKAIEIHPDYTAAYNNLGNAYNNTKEYDKAIQNFKKALELNPNYADAYSNMGMALYKLDKNDEAIEYFNKALELNPNNAETYNNLGISYFDKRFFDLSINSYLKAIELKPDFISAYSNLSVVYLIKGDFENGWGLYECRFANKGPNKIRIPVLSQPRWNGESLKNKTIYVYAEQGFGDTIMFSRYILMLKDIAKKVILKPHSPLKELFEINDFNAEIIDDSMPEKNIKFDVHLPLLSLPLIFKTNLNNIPYSEGYLKADTEKINFYKHKYFNNDNFKVGIFWHGDHRYIPKKSTNLSYFYKFAQLPDIKLYSLQKGYGIEQIKDKPENIDITDLGAEFHDYSSTAAAIANLDLVVTIDTSVAHLAAAMKKPTWILLHSENEWRWMLDREDSPWYKSVRLFRQKESGNWDELFDRVCDELKFILDKKI